MIIVETMALDHGQGYSFVYKDEPSESVMCTDCTCHALLCSVDAMQFKGSLRVIVLMTLL